MTSLPSYGFIFCFRLPYPLKFLNSLFLDGFDLNWSRGQFLFGVDSESEKSILHQRPILSQYWPFLANLHMKNGPALLNNRVAMVTTQVTDKQNLYFWMLYTQTLVIVWKFQFCTADCLDIVSEKPT